MQAGYLLQTTKLKLNWKSWTKIANINFSFLFFDSWLINSSVCGTNQDLTCQIEENAPEIHDIVNIQTFSWGIFSRFSEILQQVYTSEDIFWSGNWLPGKLLLTGNTFNCQRNGKKITLVFNGGLCGCRDPWSPFLDRN